MRSLLFRKISQWMGLGAGEVRALESLLYRQIRLRAQHCIHAEDELLSYSYVVDYGWSARYKLLHDGRQQIINFVLPGDMLGKDSIFPNRVDHSIVTITETRLWQIDPAHLLETFENFPGLAMAICWYGSREKAILEEQITRIGRRNAIERIAHLILELYKRLEITGFASGQNFEFPLTQEHIADALGLTTVHVNRTLRRMTNDGLIDYTDSLMKIRDYRRLSRIAGFDASYLAQYDRKYPAAACYERAS